MQEAEDRSSSTLLGFTSAEWADAFVAAGHPRETVSLTVEAAFAASNGSFAVTPDLLAHLAEVSSRSRSRVVEILLETDIEARRRVVAAEPRLATVIAEMERLSAP